MIKQRDRKCLITLDNWCLLERLRKEDNKQCFSGYHKHFLNKKLTCYFIYLVLCACLMIGVPTMLNEIS